VTEGTGFQPDAATLALLQAEHVNGTWVGRELLPVASRIRNAGGSEDDYRRWVTASNLWMSYTGSTGDRIGRQRDSLEGAWEKAARSKPFELDDVLSDLLDRLAAASWPGRAGNRNRAVALAFVGFCRDRNCFTRTMSIYELAKLTPGLSPRTVSRALSDLVKIGLLDRVHRRDRLPSGRSTGRYTVNLSWKRVPKRANNPNGITGTMSTGKASLRHFCQMGDEVYEVDAVHHDLWTYRGLGQSALRVWELLPDHPGSDVMGLDDPASFYGDDTIAHVGKSSADLVTEAGLSRRTVDTALKRLFDNCLVVELPGRPHRWVRAVYPPIDAIADVLGCAGAIADSIDRITQRQGANRAAFAGSYARNNHAAPAA
jgi:DNA-binding transcriptional ArsR family regulator